jgi:hypothetical protein
MSGYINKGKRCTAEGCPQFTRITTPRGVENTADEQGRCPRCSKKNYPVDPTRVRKES